MAVTLTSDDIESAATVPINSLIPLSASTASSQRTHASYPQLQLVTATTTAPSSVRSRKSGKDRSSVDKLILLAHLFMILLILFGIGHAYLIYLQKKPDTHYLKKIIYLLVDLALAMFGSAAIWVANRWIYIAMSVLNVACSVISAMVEWKASLVPVLTLFNVTCVLYFAAKAVKRF